MYRQPSPGRDRAKSAATARTLHFGFADNLLGGLDDPVQALDTSETKKEQPSKSQADSEAPDGGKPRPRPLKPNVKAGKPGSALFLSDKEAYSKSGAFRPPTKPGTQPLKVRQASERVSIFDYELKEIEQRDFRRKIAKSGAKRADSKSDMLNDM